MANASITAPRSTRHIRADVQGLRAVAVLLVIVFHAGLPLPAGFAGVDVFFVISGFVITALILRQLDAGGFSLVEFYVRRIKRLLPALILMLVVVLALSFLLESPLGPQQTTAKTGVGAMLLVANMVILRTSGDYFDAAATTNPLLHMWSLSVEEQFYLGSRCCCCSPGRSADAGVPHPGSGHYGCRPDRRQLRVRHRLHLHQGAGLVRQRPDQLGLLLLTHPGVGVRPVRPGRLLGPRQG